MDIESRKHWVDYSKAKDQMINFTDTKLCPWYIVEADSKKAARINCISHILTKIEYQELEYEEVVLPEVIDKGYQRPPRSETNIIEDVTQKL